MVFRSGNEGSYKIRDPKKGRCRCGFKGGRKTHNIYFRKKIGKNVYLNTNPYSVFTGQLDWKILAWSQLYPQPGWVSDQTNLAKHWQGEYISDVSFYCRFVKLLPWVNWKKQFLKRVGIKQMICWLQIYSPLFTNASGRAHKRTSPSLSHSSGNYDGAILIQVQEAFDPQNFKNSILFSFSFYAKLQT